MSDHPIDPTDVLISLATAVLTAAETDAGSPDSGLVFRPEWRPTPRTRSSTSQPQGSPETNQSLSWLSFIINQLSRSGFQFQQDQPPLPPPPAQPAPSSTSPPVLPPPTAASAASQAPSNRLPQPQLQEDAVTKLLEENHDVFDKLINHPFPQTLGDGSASLDGFRYYMIQDTLYLETCARLKMAAVAQSLNFNDVKNFVPRHMSSLEYVKKTREILISMLGVPESIIDNTPRSKNLDASEKYYLASVKGEDAFFAYYVVLLPCVLSYWTIAERLMDDPSTVRNAVYHPAWIEVNYDRSSADKYIKFINANIAAKGGVDRWNHTFRIACLLEADLFNTGLQAPTPYQIVPNGTYSIQSSSAPETVVLASRNEESLMRPPLDECLDVHFPSHAGSSVVGVNKTGGNNEKWLVVVTKDGYTFQNVETGHYLGITTKSGRKEGRILQAVLQPYYWWINPVRNQSNEGSSLYQIYESKNLRYTLHAEIEARKSDIACEDFEGPCQMWSFEPEQDEDGPRLPKQTSTPSESKDKSEPILIAVMGMSKSGKSTFINLASQSEELPVGHSIQSCTDTIEAASPFELDGRQVILFETPGFHHTRKSEVEILRIIAAELEALYRKAIKLHGIIYLHRISDIRVDDFAKAHFCAFRKLCGDQSIRNVVIVTNMWSKVNAEDGMKRICSLQSADDFFKPALDDGARLMHHAFDTLDSAHKIIGSAINNHPETLAIQEELVDKHLDIDKTSVGRVLDKMLSERIKRDEDRLDLLERVEAESEDKDEETRMELQEELQKVRDTTWRLGEERMNHPLDYKRLQALCLETSIILPLIHSM